MPDIFLRPGEASPNDIRLRDTTTADAGSFTSTATWDQAPASWAATAAETFDSTASFTQAAATWAAVAEQTFAATGSFVQAAAAWAAIVSETFAATATWTQAAATWDALGAVTGAEPAAEIARPHGAALVTGRAREYRVRPRAIALRAAFVQPAASWAAEMTTQDDDYWMLFDEPALIGAR